MLDRSFRRMGLNGKAVLPLVLGLGCVTMATVSTRMLDTRRERLQATLLLALASPEPAAAQSPIFLLDSAAGVSTYVFRVDPATGQLTTAGTLPTGFGEALGLAAASDNLLYVTTDSGAVLEVTVSPFGFVNRGTVLGRLVGLAFSTDGILYATDEASEELEEDEEDDEEEDEGGDKGEPASDLPALEAPAREE